MSEPGPRRPVSLATIALAAIAVLFILSGLAGITVGGISADAGVWLVVVGFIGLVLVAVEIARRQAVP